MKHILLISLSILIVSCKSQGKKDETVKIDNSPEQQSISQIGEYVVEIVQDSKGNLWFGTLEQGVAKFDGAKLIYYTSKDGLPSNRIVNIIEDKSGNLWFGTGIGLSKYDGKSFTNYSEKDGLCSDMISNLLIDSKGIFWIGTWGGVCKFNGSQFENFSLPYPNVETKINLDTKDWITALSEDSKGNIWFGRDGYGLIKFEGNSFVHFTTKEGLNSNNVQSIAEDKEGNMWIGTRVAEKDNTDPNKRIGKGGLNKYDGRNFTQFPHINGLTKNDVFTIYKDNSDKLWFSTTSHGVYKYNNIEFLNYDIPKSTMSFLHDQKGNMWLGCAGGLYRINPNDKIENITTHGPWN